MVIHAKKCTNCEDIIYSRANHDFRRCSCGDIAVDGGPNSEYGRVLFKGAYPETVEVQLDNISKDDLYKDYNYQKNEYGLIKGNK